MQCFSAKRSYAKQGFLLVLALCLYWATLSNVARRAQCKAALGVPKKQKLVACCTLNLHVSFRQAVRGGKNRQLSCSFTASRPPTLTIHSDRAVHVLQPQCFTAMALLTQGSQLDSWYRLSYSPNVFNGAVKKTRDERLAHSCNTVLQLKNCCLAILQVKFKKKIIMVLRRQQQHHYYTATDCFSEGNKKKCHKSERSLAFYSSRYTGPNSQ